MFHVARDVRDIVFRFVGQTRSLDKATTQAEKGLGGISGSLKKVAGLAAGAFAVGSIVEFGRASITAASDYNESINAVEVATGEAADSILALGDTSAEAFGLTRTQVNEAAVAMDGFLEKMDQPQGELFEDILLRATDFASVMNLDVSDSLAKFQSGLAGESEPLRKFGLDMSAASVSAHAVAEGLHATGKNMTETEKIAARYSLLMSQTSDFQGDFANTADSAANASKVLEAKLGDMRVELGQKLLPAYENLLTVAVDVAPALGGVIDVATAGIGPFTDLTGAVSSAVDGFEDMTDILPATEKVIKGLGGYIQNVWFPGVSNITDAWSDFTLGVEESGPVFKEFGSEAEIVSAMIAKIAYEAGLATDAAEGLSDVEYDQALARVEAFSSRTTAALADVIGAFQRVKAAAGIMESLDTGAFGIGDDRGKEDADYRSRNGYPYNSP